MNLRKIDKLKFYNAQIRQYTLNWKIVQGFSMWKVVRQIEIEIG